MKKQILIAVLLLVARVAVAGQSPCGEVFKTPQVLQWEQELNQKIHALLFPSTVSRISGNECRTIGTDTIVIPVAVHIMHNGEAVGVGTNITDQQVRETVDAMTKNFCNVGGFGYSAKMKFVLAQRDPSGNASTGITRTNCSGVTNYTQYGVTIGTQTGADYYTVQKMSMWPSNFVMNIWVVNKVAGNYAGFQSGYGLLLDEGITVAAPYFSKTSSTPTHEAGHFFSLSHTFAGSSGFTCPINNDCSVDGDGVCDTPPHTQYDQGPTTPCYNGDATASTYNYMSYGSRTDRFTAGQVARMYAAIIANDYRWTLVKSAASIPISTSLEVALTVSNQSSEKVCGTFVPRVKITNYGNATVNSLEIETWMNGVYQNTTVLNGTNIARSLNQDISLTPVTAIFGTQSVQLILKKVNGVTTDYFLRNNTDCKSVTLNKAQYNVAVSSQQGSATGSGTFNCGDTVTITAPIVQCQDFVGWYEGSNLVFIEQAKKFMLTADRNFMAHYAPKMVQLVLQKNIDGGTVEGAATLPCGTTQVAKASPKFGFTFLYWKKNNAVYSTAMETQIDLFTSDTLTAYFQGSVTGVATNLNEIAGIYPNPATISVQITVRSNGHPYTIQILDVVGRVMNESKFQNTSTFNLDVSTFSKGVYIVKVEDESGIATSKFLIQ